MRAPYQARTLEGVFLVCLTLRSAYLGRCLDAEGVCHGADGACRDFQKGPGEIWTLTEVPIPLDCGAPRKWRNTHGCAVDPLNPDADPNEFARSMGTEADWMTFLRGLEGGGVGLSDMMSIYNHACHPENRHFALDGSSLPECLGTQDPTDGCYVPNLRCADDPGYEDNDGDPVKARPTYWLDRAAVYDPITNPPWPLAPVYDQGGFLDGARRKWGAQDGKTLVGVRPTPRARRAWKPLATSAPLLMLAYGPACSTPQRGGADASAAGGNLQTGGQIGYPDARPIDPDDLNDAPTLDPSEDWVVVDGECRAGQFGVGWRSCTKCRAQRESIARAVAELPELPEQPLDKTNCRLFSARLSILRSGASLAAPSGRPASNRRR
jgi:hypothetical protein